jgi:hypothetical protein
MILILMTVGEFTIRTMVSHRDKRDVDVVGPSYCIFMLVGTMSKMMTVPKECVIPTRTLKESPTTNVIV